jgi:hypothetical protein
MPKKEIPAGTATSQTVTTIADHVFQDDRIPQIDHLASWVVNHSFHALEHPKRFSTEPEHLDRECQTSIFPLAI